MRFSKVTRILVASVAATVISASGASAVELSANAVSLGAERVASVVTTRSAAGTTSLSISGPSKVRKGTTVTIKGKLTSSASECVRQGQWIRIYRKSAVVGNGTTKAAGGYRIKVKVTKNRNIFRARFAGSAVGVHPDDVVCFASTSSKLKVKGT